VTVAGRIATGTALLILLLVAALVFHLTVVRRLAESNHAMASDQISLVVRALDTLRGLERLDESARKLAVTGDPGYAAQLAERRRELAADLGRIRSAGLAPNERDAAERLDAAWREFVAALPEPASVGMADGPGERARLLAPALGRIVALRAEAQSLVSAANEELDRQGRRAADELVASARLAFMLFAVALVVGVAAVVLAIRAVQRPLQSLVEATARIAEQNYVAVEAPGVDEFSRLTSAFNEMASRLAELDEMKRNLLSHVSHELRTPLANIEESHRLLLDGLSGPLTDGQRHLLELNVASCERLGRLISNLLDVSRFDAGAVDLHTAELDLREVASTVAAELAARAREAGLLLAVDLPSRPLPVLGDRERLLQVLHNLVDNAIKYSARGGRVEVSARAAVAVPDDLPERWRDTARDGSPCVVAEVADEGRGVPAADRERIFERFFRSEHRRGGPSGVGLGLAICRELVTAHGGAIWVTGNRPVGSRFRVLLPAAPTLAAAAHGGSFAVEARS
jgi:signal transduction histidine kinase